MNSDMDFAVIGDFFRRAREHFRNLSSEKAGVIPKDPTVLNGVHKWLLTQKERLLSRLAAHWQFLRRCKLYNVVPSHLTQRGMRMTFTCAVQPELAGERTQASTEMKQFIEACGFECSMEVTETFITYEISLGEP